MPQALGFAINASLLFFTSAGLTGGALAAATYAGAALLVGGPIALSIGANAYLAYQARKDLVPVNDNQGLQTILKQTIPAQRLVLGRATTGGALFFLDAKAPYVWYGILLAAHECGDIENLIINQNIVFLDDDGFATSVPFRDGSNIYIQASYRNGTLDQAIDPILAADFPTLPSTFRQRGHATIVIKAHYGFGANRQAQDDDHKRVYGDDGQFQPLIRFKGAKCYDPRKPGHALGDQSTWEWSDNAAVCLGRFLTHKWPDSRLLENARIDWDFLAECADDCDRWETSKDGTTFRRSTINGVVQSTDSPWDVIENMKLAYEGHLILDRGKVYPVVRKPVEPAATLHMGMLTGGIEFTSEQRKRELINIIKTQFIAPDREYQEVVGPVIRREDFIAEDGTPRERQVRGAFVEDHRRIQRKGSTELNVSRLGKTLSAGVTIEALSWVPGRVYRVHLTGALAKANGLYTLASKAWDDRIRGYRVSLIEYDPAATAFDPLDEQDFELDEDVIDAEAA
jgi:hypothetical protein